MTALEKISRAAKEQGLEFLVIGGYAVMAHGFARATMDLDLLVRAGKRAAWQKLILDLGWISQGETANFSQFNSSPESPEPVDLMFVNDATFEQMLAASKSLPVSAISSQVVSLLHLLALKCHAIKHGHGGRIEKDVDDVLELVRLNNLSVQDEEFRRIVLKYGIPELYEKLKRVTGLE